MKIIQSISKIVAITLTLTSLSLVSRAQLNPFNSMYFQNQYLYNPAMAGIEKGMNINLGYRKQWNNFPGAPKTGILTVDFQPTEKVGLGLNVNDDQTGLIRQTRIMGTYAYHLPLSDHNQQLSFGLSLGIDDSRVNYNNINGDLTDIEIQQYNQLKPYVDGDFGIAYTSNSLNMGAAVPNLKSVFFKSSDDRFGADRLLFITTASYKIPIQEDGAAFVLEPLAALRVVKGYDDIVDAGFNFKMPDYAGLSLQGIYHSNRSLGLGFGLDQQTYALNFNYNLETGVLSNYNQGAFELGLKLRLFGKK